MHPLLPKRSSNPISAHQIDSFLDIEMSEIPWAIVCKGCEEKDADKLQKLIFNTLKKVSFSSEEIDRIASPAGI